MRYLTGIYICCLLSCSREPEPCSCSDKERQISALEKQLVAARSERPTMTAAVNPQPEIARKKVVLSIDSALNAKTQTPATLLSSAIAGHAPSEEIARARAAGIETFLNQHVMFLQGQMRAHGKLKKEEYVYDENGQLRNDKLFDLMEAAQQAAYGTYHTKDKMRLIEHMDQAGEMRPVIAAGFLDLDVPAIRGVWQKLSEREAP